MCSIRIGRNLVNNKEPSLQLPTNSYAAMPFDIQFIEYGKAEYNHTLFNISLAFPTPWVDCGCLNS